MEFNNTYILKDKELTELLENMGVIVEDLNKFVGKHKRYLYTLDISKSNKEGMWNASINIKHEQENKEGTKESTEPPSLL